MKQHLCLMNRCIRNIVERVEVLIAGLQLKWPRRRAGKILRRKRRRSARSIVMRKELLTNPSFLSLTVRKKDMPGIDGSVAGTIMGQNSHSATLAEEYLANAELVERPPEAEIVIERPWCNAGRTAFIVLALLTVIGATIGVAVSLSTRSSGLIQVDTTTEPRNKMEADLCLVLDDGSIACVQEQHPAPAFITAFFDCPTLRVENVFECGRCVVIRV